MQVSRDIPAQAGSPAVLTIGNFDGVHLGHQALLKMLREKSLACGLPSLVLTFEPHPREFFAPQDAPARLATLREKLLLLEAAGVDRVHICRFNKRFASLSADDFIQRLLVQALQTRHMFIGDDFRFGRGRTGDFALLKAAGQQFGFSVETMHTLDVAGERVSSSAVRAALAEGDMEHASRLLGRPYSIAGRVLHGDKIGRTIGFPTANIQLKHRRPALSGIYAVSVEGVGPQPLMGAASVGVRPTVTHAGRASLEVNLLDFAGDLYGAHLRVHFHHKLRDEEKFDSLEALTTQIKQDVAATRTYFAGNPIPAQSLATL